MKPTVKPRLVPSSSDMNGGEIAYPPEGGLTIRAATSGEYPRLLSWLNGIFRPSIPDFFQTHYCHLFRGGPSIEATSLVAEGETGYIGHISLHRFELRTSAGPLRSAGIGCVAIAPESRGRGFARQLMAAAHRKAVMEGCILCLLGGIRSVYAGMGYEICGLQYQWMWDRQQRNPMPGWEQIDAAKAGDIIHPLWLKAAYGVLWPREVFAKLPQRTGWQAWVDARREAYALVKVREADVLVDHFLVTAEGFGPMMDAISHYYQAPILVRHPAGIPFLHEEMTRTGMDPKCMSLGMLKILDAKALRSECERHDICTGPYLDAIAGSEFSSEPTALARQRLASRKIFGDPFEPDFCQPHIQWDWDNISHI